MTQCTVVEHDGFEREALDAAQPRARSRQIAGPEGLPFIGSLVQFARDPIAFHDDLLRRFGDEPLIHFRVNGRGYYILNEPQLIEEIFVKNQDALVKDGRFIRIMNEVAGKSLLTREGADHLRVRRGCQQAFSKSQLRLYAGHVLSSLREITARWDDSEVVDTRNFTGLLTLNVIARSMFSVTVERDLEETTAALGTIVHYVSSKMRPTLPWRTLFRRKGEQEVGAAVALIESRVAELLARHDSDGETGNDIVAVLKRAHDGKERPVFSPEEIRAEALTMFIVGQETIATALNWTLYLLARYPSAQERLVHEIEEIVGSRTLSYEDVQRLPYANSVLKESMRIYPPIWVLTRALTHERKLADCILPKGGQVVVSPYLLQRNPANFPSPLVFFPERWLEPGAERAAGFTYVPFGAGRRVCIGKTFAEMEGVLALAEICRNFRVELVSDEDPGCRALGITLQPKRAIQLKMVRR